MKCPFCAEEIQEAAILCRFCGAAVAASGDWVAPSASPPVGRRGSSTMRFAGGFFLLSCAFSLASVTSDVALFGAMRGGAIAVLYNLFFAVLFLGMGLALLFGQWWGYRVFMAGTSLYSLDRLLFLLDKNTRDAYLTASGVTREVRGLVDVGAFDEGVFLATIVSLVCWWGFAVYIWLRRDYFR